ncbi:Hsp70 family protein [Stieleria varia]|uniref:Chaperone protein DnaK n=1 Tax=Stieleria varia TaxID=2528005 RepID=A0A5C5ZR11_9BACT|nr:Hsp70 family protein [Stieleria varia]TWT89347.1 Chaperone protein DnaK [Stieleria varia]
MPENNRSDSHPAVGIDLGTTFSAVAYLDASGRPETIRNAEGDLTTPSAVFFDRTHPIVGVEAVEAGLMEPERLALYAKRDVGEVRYEKQIRGEHLPPEVLQALVLRKLKEDAELKLGEIQKAVVTVPAFFNEPCRKATQDAGRLAGLEVLDIINEPTAAAITYGVEQGFLSEDGVSKQRERILVYDLGGGTFDVTVMDIDAAEYNTVATAGDVYLGGIDWDRRIVDFISEEFLKEHGVDPRLDPQAEQELLRKANQTKHALTQRESVSIAFAHDGMRLRTQLDQTQFAKLCDDLVERTLLTVQLVLDDAKITWSDLTRLILVGGSTRMPMVRSELEKRSGMTLDRSLSPDEAVSHGAALYAGMLLGHKGESCRGIRVSNVNSHDLGVLAIDPKTGQPRRQVMIPRNSPLPARKRVRFRTHKDNQPNVKIDVVEGGDDRGTNATSIGKCLVDDLPAKTPKGTNVDVQFDYTQDGRLTVRASLPEMDRKIKLTLNRAAGLSDEQIEAWRERMEKGLGDPDPNDIAVETSAGTTDAPAETAAAEATTVNTPVIQNTEKPIVIATASPTTNPPTGPVKIAVAGGKSEPKPTAVIPAISTGAKPVPVVDDIPDFSEIAGESIKVGPVKIEPVQPTSVPKPAAVSSMISPAPASPAPASATPPSNATTAAAPVINIPGVSDAPKPKVDVTKLFGNLPDNPKPPAATPRPMIKLGDDPNMPPPKVNPSDLNFEQLAGLSGGAAKKPAPSAVPIIQTDAAPSAAKSKKPAEKKSGGLFGRKKKKVDEE